MHSRKKPLRDGAVTAVVLVVSFLLSQLLQDVLNAQASIPMVFVFAVFLISLTTQGYLWGIVAAFASVVAVNYAFTFPYFKINFTIPENFVSALIMIAVALMTSALITKLKQQETIRVQAERERMRADLLRAVSHDLRTPLTTIYGSSSALLEGEGEFTAAQRERMLRGIQEDALWLVRMVENLLSVTRLDGGNVKLIKTPVVAEELIDAVLVKFRKRYPEQSVKLQLPEELMVIPMDAILIEQVLVNILENAVQHAAGMTELTLRVKRQGDWGVFEIQDDGCGVPPERLATIFAGGSPSSEDIPADGQKRNTGIGLSVCAAIIKAHGGNISAENSGTGMCFRFSLALEEV